MKGRLEDHVGGSGAQLISPDEGSSVAVPGGERAIRRGWSAHSVLSAPTWASLSQAPGTSSVSGSGEARALEELIRRMRLDEGFSLPRIARILGLALPVVGASLLRGTHRKRERPRCRCGHERSHDPCRAKPPTDALVGHTLAHYRVLSVLGRGGMGVVYRAFDSSLEREVALKVLHSRATRDPRGCRQLLREARAAASLASPQTCAVYEVDEADGTPYMAMELVRGQRLQELLRRTAAGSSGDPGSPLPLGQALKLAAEIARGVAGIHDLGFVHRDLKPSNVMVTDSGHARLIDFGLAAPLEPPTSPDSGAETPEGTVGSVAACGTPSYMSPEQVRGVAVDERSDIFTFGVLLYEMLTGANPFRRPSHAATQEAILYEPVHPLRLPLAPTSARRTLLRTLQRCLAKSPRDRHRSMHDVVVELEKARGEARARPSRPSLAAPSAAQWALGFLAGVAGAWCALSLCG